MKKISIYLMIISIISLLVSCGSTKTLSWPCYVDAIGEHPSNKSYYVEGRFPQDVNPLVAKEYIKDLDIIMLRLGYIKVDSAEASIKIAFGYELGEKEDRAYTYSTPVFQYNPPTNTTTNTTIKTDKGTTIAKINSTTSSDNKYGTVSYAGERTNTSYITKQSIFIFLDAFDLKSKEPIWSVRVNDKKYPLAFQNLREYLPFYLLNMYPYIGNNSGSTIYSQILYNDERLLWFKSKTQQ